MVDDEKVWMRLVFRLFFSFKHSVLLTSQMIMYSLSYVVCMEVRFNSFVRNKYQFNEKYLNSFKYICSINKLNMVKIQKRSVKTNGHFQLTLKVRSNTWISDMIIKHFRNENFEMVKRYLKVTCKELENYFIANDDILNLVQLTNYMYQLEIVKYSKKI